MKSKNEKLELFFMIMLMISAIGCLFIGWYSYYTYESKKDVIREVQEQNKELIERNNFLTEAYQRLYNEYETVVLTVEELHNQNQDLSDQIAEINE